MMGNENEFFSTENNHRNSITQIKQKEIVIRIQSWQKGMLHLDGHSSNSTSGLGGRCLGCCRLDRGLLCFRRRRLAARNTSGSLVIVLSMQFRCIELRFGGSVKIVRLSNGNEQIDLLTVASADPM